MMKIKVGADELILWLRKNEKATIIPNDGIQGLGHNIYDLIVTELGGERVNENYPSYWANLQNDRNIGQYNLPRTSAQYEIDSSKLEDLYVELDRW